MVTKNPIKKNKRPMMREGVYTIEQKKWLLARIACDWSSPVIQEEFKELYPGHKVPCHQVISQYKTRYSVDIEELRNELRRNLVRSGAPFVEKFQRVFEYGRMAMVEQRRKRYKEERECLHAIAEEMGDLKTTVEHSGSVAVEELSVEETIAAIREIIDSAGVEIPESL